MDFVRISQQNQVGNTICQYLISSLQSAFFRTFGKNNALAVRLGALNNVIN